MARKTPTVANNPNNKKRTAAKLARNKGQDAIKKSGKSESEWAQMHDPLFKVKGKERHKRLHP